MIDVKESNDNLVGTYQYTVVWAHVIALITK